MLWRLSSLAFHASPFNVFAWVSIATQDRSANHFLFTHNPSGRVGGGGSLEPFIREIIREIPQRDS
jgi:hypothetical protein